MKKFVSLLFALCLLVGCFPPAASAEYEYVEPAGEWITVPGIEGGRIKFDKGTGAITSSDQSITSADIPGTIDGVAVKKIGLSAFYLCEMTHLTLPEGLQVIEKWAFSECWQLEGSVTIPESVTAVGEEAFRGVSILTALEAAPGNGAYCSVDGVLFSKDRKTLVAYPGGKGSAYEIPAGTTKILPGVFSCSLDLTDVTIPSSITEIDTEVFMTA